MKLDLMITEQDEQEFLRWLFGPMQEQNETISTVVARGLCESRQPNDYRLNPARPQAGESKKQPAARQALTPVGCSLDLTARSLVDIQL